MSRPEHQAKQTLAPLFEPPYYAVIFTNTRREGDNGYDHMSEKMVDLASRQPGYLGMESVRDAAGTGITVSYWRDLDAIKNWRKHAEHTLAQQEGRATWYGAYRLRIAKVERNSAFEKES